MTAAAKRTTRLSTTFGHPASDQTLSRALQSDQRHRVGVADAEIRPMGVEGADDDADNDAKYVKRQSSLQRSIKRFFPSAFQPTLPVTTRYAVDLVTACSPPHVLSACVHPNALRESAAWP